MVLILDGNSEIGVQIRSNLFDFIFVIHLIRYQEQSQNVFFPPKRAIMLHACATCFELP